MCKLIPAGNGWLCPDDPGEPGRDSPRWSVNADEARLVSVLCRGLTVLEIGTGLGVSTKEIAKRAKLVYTVDIDPWVKKAIAPRLPVNARFFESLEGVPSNLDIAFIDGLHEYNQCRQDIKDARTLVKKDGLFIFHDMKMEAVFNAVRDSGLAYYLIRTEAGMAIAWNK
jgi:hypothetical protein